MEIKILLIDNSAELPSELAVMLFDAGYHVYNIACQEDCFEIIQANNPEIIIFNNFSETNNPEIFKKFKGVSEKNHIIFISENVYPENKIKQNLELGADSYILSPFNDEDLLLHISSKTSQ